MSNKTAAIAIALITAALLVFMVPSGVARSQEVMKALVVNLATPHPIVGKVSVERTIRHTDTVRINDVLVPSARREEPARWLDAGVVETSGFTYLALSVQGYVKGRIGQPGVIGVILIPEEEPILQALNESQIHLPLEVTADVAPAATSYFSASEPRLPIAFPRYRIWVYNSTGESASANVFLYLTN
jgi:hypothetical protein